MILYHQPAPKEVIMAKGQRPQWKVLIGRENGDKQYYTEIGVAWNVAKGGISIQLHALPVDGKMVLFLRENE